MSISPISPIPFLSESSFVNQKQPQIQSSLQDDDAQRANAQPSSDLSFSGNPAVAAQAFTAFQPNAKPIATLIPATDVPPALSPVLAANSTDSPTTWSATIVDVYA